MSPEEGADGDGTTDGGVDVARRGTGDTGPMGAAALALRARMILACAEGRTNMVVAAELGVTHQTVGKWRARFVARGLDGLCDAPRSGRAAHGDR